jgi:hypothetical protein
MSISPEDQAVIDAGAAGLDENDFPVPPADPPALDPITSNVFNQAAILLLSEGWRSWSYWTARRIRAYAKDEYNKNFSLEQMQAIRDAIRERYNELFNSGE